MKRCVKCIMPDTRPRLSFDENGVCAACQWHEEKKTKIDWAARMQELQTLCDDIRGKQKYDCLVPVSGGKDSSYVAHKMKHDCKLNVLTVNITPPLETDLIQQNLKRFLSYGYDNIKITPNPVIMQYISKKGFVEQGRPLLSWTTCVITAMLQIATSMDVPLIMFGEEGESEYGGSTRLRYTPYYNVLDSIDLYLSGNDPAQHSQHFPARELVWWTFPDEKTLAEHPVKIAHWSYFENWNSYDHYVFARNQYGLQERETRSLGTYTGFGQTDTPLYELHTYLMYLKFGFGRCLQDACIDIRGGGITRDEAVELTRKYDGESIEEYIPQYLEYFQMTRAEFDAVLDRHTNKALFTKVNGVLRPNFTIA